MFADDTNIFVVGNSKREAYCKANKILCSIHKYMACNLLHINIKKCCYMYFAPNKNASQSTGDNPEQEILLLDGIVIKRVSEARFLGVLIDDQLNWKPHLAQLNTKLKSSCGRLYRLRSALPESLHRTLYQTLFESHISYGISVWGGVSTNKLEPIFLTQKKCIRIMFGDIDAYLDKYKTCARTREWGSQKLGQEFYKKEPSKPLFTKHRMLTVHNLHRYHSILETFKIIKSQVPRPMYELFHRSSLRETRLITPSPSHNFAYTASTLWNDYQNSSGIEDLTVSIGAVKHSLKKLLLIAQKRYEPDAWCNLNYTEF